MTIKQKKLPENWKESVNPESLKRAVAVGVILPKLDISGMGLHESLAVEFISEPKLIVHPNLPNGEGYFVDVKHDELAKSMPCPNSLIFSLMKEMELNSLETPIGHSFKIGKGIGKTQYNEKSTLYWVQFLE